jgi:hypothetical protein
MICIGNRLRRVVVPAVAAGILGGSVAGTSCIIPDHGIVALVDCGIRWCATAEHAKALNQLNNPVDVLEPKPDGSVGWVTECICMTPTDDLVLRAEAPAMQYDLLRNQVLDAARQACLDRALANQLDPDPPPPSDALLDVTCTEAVTTIVRDGCCKLRNDLCGGSTQSCDDDPTGGEDPGPFVPSSESSDGANSADSTGGDSTTTEGSMSSLAPLHAEVVCEGTTCTIGQPLIDAIVSSPEAVLAEGTSLTFASSEGVVIGMELRGVERDNLAGHLGLRNGDVVVLVADMPVRDEAELLAAAEHAASVDALTVELLRDGRRLVRHFVRDRS